MKVGVKEMPCLDSCASQETKNECKMCSFYFKLI